MVDDVYRTREGRPVENVELWKDLVRELRKLSAIRRTEIKWAKGHSRDNPHNMDADRLAKASASGPLHEPLKPVSVRRKKTADAKLARAAVAAQSPMPSFSSIDSSRLSESVRRTCAQRRSSSGSSSEAPSR